MEREKERKEYQRREKGIRSMEEYQSGRKHEVEDRLFMLKQLLIEKPHLNNKELAEKLCVSTGTIHRMKSQL